MKNKPIIVLHSSGEINLGGPMMGLQRILFSSLKEKYHFETCIQKRAAKGINIKLIFELAAEIKRYSPDLLHISGLGNEGFHALMAGRLAGCSRILTTVHGTHRDMSFSIKQFIVSRILEPITLRYTDGAYCVCEYASKRKFIKKAKSLLGYIHNAVEMPDLKIVDNKIKNEFGFSNSDIVALYVGRLCLQKGFSELFDAYDLLVGQGVKKLKLLIVGDGNDGDAIKGMVQNKYKNQIIFAGKRCDVIEIMKSCHYLVLPSYYENLPYVLIEAMSCQKPVIATDVGGVSEVVKNNINGILVKSKNINELAMAMSLMTEREDIREKYGFEARETIEKKFSMPLYLTRLDSVYQKMLHL